MPSCCDGINNQAASTTVKKEIKDVQESRLTAEHLDAVVGIIHHIHSAITRVHRNPLGIDKLTIARTFRPPFFYECPIGIKYLDTVIIGIRHGDSAIVRIDCDARGI